MDAKSLNCPNCGAACDSQSKRCGHCGSALATVRCAACFGLAFQGSEFCPICGARLARTNLEPVKGPCPRCGSQLTRSMLGDVPLDECGNCFGLWTDTESFKQICADRERQSLLLGNVAQFESIGSAKLEVRYLKCPRCLTLMNRVNFSKCSGVIIDVCRAHGVWFDANELHHIVQFIQTGGLDFSRQKEKEEIAEQLRRLEWERRHQASNSDASISHYHSSPIDLSDIFGAAGSLIDWFKDR